MKTVIATPQGGPGRSWQRLEVQRWTDVNIEHVVELPTVLLRPDNGYLIDLRKKSNKDNELLCLNHASCNYLRCVPNTQIRALVFTSDYLDCE